MSKPVSSPFASLGLDARLVSALVGPRLRGAHPHPERGDSAAHRRHATSSARPRPAPGRPPRSRCPSSTPCRRFPREASPLRPSILVPTRELAMQLAEAVHKYGREMNVRVLPVYGGASMETQLRALKRGVDVVVATPGARARPRQPQVARPRKPPDARPRRGRRDARHGLRGGSRRDPRGDPEDAPDGALLGDAAAAHRHARGPPPPRPDPDRHREGEDRAREDAEGPADGVRRRPRPQARGARPHPRPREPGRGARLLPHAHRGRRPDREPQGARDARRGDARRDVAGAARPRHEEVPRGDARAPHRDGRGGARPRHRASLARRELRRALLAGGLRPPHRPDGARRAARASPSRSRSRASTGSSRTSSA